MGESAAILTSCFWTASSLLFTSAGRKIGAFSVNAYRTTMAIVLLACTHAVFLGDVLPVASGGQWFWMGLSGIVGLGIGDFGLFAAYVTIGPRRSVLVQASSPIFAAVGAYLMFGDTLSLLSVLGIAVTLTGIAVVLLERQETSEEKLTANRGKRWGLFFGLISAMGQGFGVVLSRKGMYLGVSEAMNPISAALIRMLLAGLFVWTIILFAGKLPGVQKAAKNREGIKYTAAGAGRRAVCGNDIFHDCSGRSFTGSRPNPDVFDAHLHHPRDMDNLQGKDQLARHNGSHRSRHRRRNTIPNMKP